MTMVCQARGLTEYTTVSSLFIRRAIIAVIQLESSWIVHLDPLGGKSSSI